jgi:hypothetical protein
MFIKLTNDAEKYEGTTLVMAVDVIMTIFMESNGEEKQSTFICHRDGKTVWKVQETVDQILDKINMISKK